MKREEGAAAFDPDEEQMVGNLVAFRPFFPCLLDLYLFLLFFLLFVLLSLSLSLSFPLLLFFFFLLSLLCSYEES